MTGSGIDSSVTRGKTLLDHADEPDYAQPTLPEDAAPGVIRCCYQFQSYLCSTDEGCGTNFLKHSRCGALVAVPPELSCGLILAWMR